MTCNAYASLCQRELPNAGKQEGLQRSGNTCPFCADCSAPVSARAYVKNAARKPSALRAEPTSPIYSNGVVFSRTFIRGVFFKLSRGFSLHFFLTRN